MNNILRRESLHPNFKWPNSEEYERSFKKLVAVELQLLQKILRTNQVMEKSNESRAK